MLKVQFSVYLGKESEDGFFGFIPDEKFFLILDIKEGFTKELGRQILAVIKTNLSGKVFDNLFTFENFINEEIRKHNLPTGLSLVAGYLSGNVFYLKTVGQGRVYIKRKNKLTKIIEGENTASGIVRTDDFFVFTTDRFMNIFSEDQLKTNFDHRTPSEVVENLAPEIMGADDHGAIALFLQLVEFKESNVVEKDEEIVSKPLFLEKGQHWINNFFQKFSQYRREGGKKRTLTMGLAAVIIIVLFWSVGLGVVRRQESLNNEKINKSRELIVQKLDQAEEVAFLNLPRSKTLIDEAKQELGNLKKTVKNNQKAITDIENLIKEREDKIVKKEDKQFQEFFDLTIDKKEAAGDKIYLDDDTLDILDNKQGIIYKLSLAKKSLDKVVNAEIKSASLIAGYQGNVYFYSAGRGVYSINDDSKAKLVIDNDKDWGKIAAMTVYNGNLYLLDAGKSQIYKYLAGEDKFGDKNNYFKAEEAIDLKDANSLAIDSSVYIGFSDFTAKFTAGVREEFKTSFPNEQFNLNKVIANKNLEKIYSWDKDNGSLYVLGKNGSYERQVSSSVFNRGGDIAVFENSAYIIVKEKIYRVTLD